MRPSTLRVATTIALALATTACPAPDPIVDPTIDDRKKPEPPVAVSLANRVLLFVMPSGSSSSEFLPGLGISLDTDYEYLFRYVPSLNKLEQLERHSSPSYAPSSKTWYSADDRLFIAQEYRPYEVTGRTDISEYTYDSQFIKQVSRLPPMSHGSGCVAAVGDTYYFRRNRNYDLFYGDVGGEFYKATIAATSSSQILLPYSSSANCFGYLQSAGGALYDVLTNPKDKPATFALYRRDLTTGMPEATPLVPLSETTPNAFAANSYRFAVDEGVFYLARRRIADNGVEIWKAPLDRSTQPTKIFDQNTGFSPYWFEVDDGHVMLAAVNGQVLLWDIASGQKQTVSFGGSITTITQIFARR